MDNASTTPIASAPPPPPGVPVVAPGPPWERPELFSYRPAEPPYGFIVRGVRTGCTRDELIARCRAAQPHVDLVWTPEFPRLLPPAEVPWLLEAAIARTSGNLQYNLKNGLGLTLIWTTLGALYYLKGTPLALVAIIVLMLGVIPVIQPAWGLWRMSRDPGGYAREQAGILRYQMWLGTRRAFATGALCIALVAVFVTQWAVGVDRSILVAGIVKPAVHDGQAWRLLTGAMLHGHLVHLGFNLFALMALGRLVEMHGHPLYLPTVFLFSAICASGLSYVATPATSVGASGGIMGLIGFLGVLGLRRRHVVPRGFLKSIALSVALTAATGIVAHEFIDNAAHAGGLFGGVLLGAVYVTRRPSERGELRLTPSPMAKVAGYLSTAVLAATTLATVMLLLSSRQGR